MRRNRVKYALPVVEYECVPEDKPPNTFGNDLDDFANDAAAEAMANQHDVGEIAADNEVDDRLGRLGVANLFADALAVSRSGWPNSSVTAVLQAADHWVPHGSVVPCGMNQDEG